MFMEENERKDKDKKKAFFKMVPQTSKRIKQNIMLAVGLVFIVVGVIVTAFSYSSAESFKFKPSILAILLGAVFLFFGMGLLQSSFVIFVGLMISLLGVPFFLAGLEIIEIIPIRMIPYAMICAGGSLFISGMYKFHKPRPSYIFPSAMLIILGIFFWLFSAGILSFSLTTFTSRWLPLMVLILGIGLVAVFYVQQIMKKDFPYMEEEKDESLEDDSNEGEHHGGASEKEGLNQ